MESDNIDIIDFSGEKFNKISIPCSVSLFLILLLVLLNLFLSILFPWTFISIFTSLIIILIFGLYYYYVMSKNPGIRKFSISTEKIEIIIPKLHPFLIFWSDFNKIEIKLKKFNYEPFYIYELHFIHQNSDKSFNLSLSEFPKEKINQILLLLKNYAKRIGKQFTATQETWISGVYLVENLKI
ncbi:MAG: hypothetical protein ACFFDN_21865 [Candidatus Hodarchaeota archaeon]